MRPTGIHPTAVIGEPPEHREYMLGDSYFQPEIDETARVNALCTIDGGLAGPTRVGARSFLMAHTHVGHDAQIGADCEFAPHCSVGGHVQIGDRVKVGQGAIFKPFVKIGDGARIGMGAIVIRDVPAGEVWAGNPARPIRRPATGPVLTEAEERGWEQLAATAATAA